MGRALVSAPATLGALAALLVCWSLQTGWKASFGPLFQWLGNLGLSIPIPHFPDVSIHPFGFALTLDRNVRAWLSQGVALSERAFVKFLWYTVEPFLLMAGVTLALALALYELGNYLVHVAPKITTRVIHERLIKPATKTITVVKGTSAALFRQLTARVDALAHRVAHIAAVIPHAIPQTFPRVGRLEKTAKAQAARITRLEKLLAAGLGVALLTRTLGRLGLGCLLGRNGKKAVGSLCKINPGILDALLVDTLALTVAFNLEEFARELQTVTGEAASIIHKFAD